MKKLLSLIGLVLFLGCACADVWIEGYFRKDGTYVQGHWRSEADGIKWNNRSEQNN